MPIPSDKSDPYIVGGYLRMQGPIMGYCLVLGAEPLKLGPGQPIEVLTSKLRQGWKISSLRRSERKRGGGVGRD